MPSSTITTIPMMMYRRAQAGPSPCACPAERSMRKLFKSSCLVSIAMLVDPLSSFTPLYHPLASESIENVLPRCMPGRSDASEQSHNDGEGDSGSDHCRGHSQAEHNFAECGLVLRSRSHAVERQHQHNPNHRTQK